MEKNIKQKLAAAFIVSVFIFLPFISSAESSNILIENVTVLRDGAEVKRPIPFDDFVSMVMEKIALLETTIRSLGKTPVNQVTVDSNLSLGSVGLEVKDLQVLLNSTDELKVAVDGPGSAGFETEYFGPLTKDAVLRFQQAYDLTPSGMVDGETREALNALFVR